MAWSIQSCVGLLVFGTMLSCNSIAGINDPKDQAPGSSGGTSGTSGTTGDPVDRFLGRWTTPAANQQITGCNIRPNPSGPGTLDVLRGDQSGTIVVGPCGIVAAVVGDVATAFDNQSCSDSAQDGSTVTSSYVVPTTFTLTSSTQANVVITYAAVFSPSGVTCGVQETGTFTKQ
jgi:hypothetical protein